MAGWVPPLEPDEPEEEFSYDPYYEQDKTPTERQYDEMNREERPDGLA